MNLVRKLLWVVGFARLNLPKEAAWLCILMTLGLCRTGVGQTIPSWFPKPPPLSPPRGGVIRVSTADELLAAVDRLATGETILLADGQYKLPRPLVLDQKQKVVLRSASGEASKVTLVGKGWERGDEHDDILRLSRCDGVTIAERTGTPDLGAWQSEKEL
jgi:hypothetical protein